MTDVYFQGVKLPALRPGKIWGMQLYPGGRKVVKMIEPAQIRPVERAADELLAGHMTYVALHEAVDAWQRYQRFKEPLTDWCDQCNLPLSICRGHD